MISNKKDNQENAAILAASLVKTGALFTEGFLDMVLKSIDLRLLEKEENRCERLRVRISAGERFYLWEMNDILGIYEETPQEIAERLKLPLKQIKATIKPWWWMGF